MHSLTRANRLIALLLLLCIPTTLTATLTGCVNVQSSGTAPAADAEADAEATHASWPGFRAELYFGLSRPARGDAPATTITDAEFQQFVDTVIVPRFPDGFTILPATGYWRDSSASKSEPSRIVIIFHPDSATAHARIKEIARAYNRQFDQQAVLLAYSTARVDFITQR
jgi:hypothetical protein